MVLEKAGKEHPAVYQSEDAGTGHLLDSVLVQECSWSVLGILLLKTGRLSLQLYSSLDLVLLVEDFDELHVAGSGWGLQNALSKE